MLGRAPNIVAIICMPFILPMGYYITRIWPLIRSCHMLYMITVLDISIKSTDVSFTHTRSRRTAKRIYDLMTSIKGTLFPRFIFIFYGIFYKRDCELWKYLWRFGRALFAFPSCFQCEVLRSKLYGNTENV